LPLLLLAAAILVLFVRLLLGEVLFWGLPALQFYPWREFAMSEFASGRVPLWNPYNGAGAPLLANYQSALLYPPHLLYFLNDGPQMMGWIGMLHLLWAGVGMWLFSGRLGLPTFARGIAVLAFPLSGTLVARFSTFPMVNVAAWLPWLLYALDGVLTAPTLRRWLLLVVVIAMQLLAGHAQWTFYSLLLAGSYGLWRLVSERKPALRLVMFGAAAGFAVLIAAAQLLPTAELQRLSQRANNVAEDFAFNFSFAPVSLLTLLNPDFFGNPGDASYVIGGAYFEVAAYLGIVPVVLALVALGRLRKLARLGGASHRSRVVFFALLTVIALVLAFGDNTPLYPLLYRYMPTFNLFQAPARWLLLYSLGASLLAAYAAAGWETTYKLRRRSRLGLACALGLIAVGLLTPSLLPQIATGEISGQLARGVAGLGVLVAVVAVLMLTQPPKDSPRLWLWQSAVLLLLAADLIWANRVSNPTVAADFYAHQCAGSDGQGAGRVRVLKDAEAAALNALLPFNDYPSAAAAWERFRCSAMPNLNLLDRRLYLSNFDPLRPAWLEALVSDAPDSPPANHAMQVAQTLTFDAAFKQLGGESHPEPLPRAWIAPLAVAVSGETFRDEVQAIYASSLPLWEPLRRVVLHADPDTDVPQGVGEPQIIPLVSETPQRLEFQTAYPSAGVLYVADTYYPGWEATIDGQPTPIYRANVGFRAVILPPGSHTVVMTYAPLTFRVGLWLSAGALLSFIVLLLFSLRRTTP
jgi:hypothetical protein